MKRHALAALAAALLAAGCNGGGADLSSQPAPETPAVQAPAAVSAGAPDPAQATARAPESFRARFRTTKGDFVVEARRSWAPNGVDRFYNLVRLGFYDGASFFRAIDGFMVQFGIHSRPEVSARWRDA